jgi:hypothetical protein
LFGHFVRSGTSFRFWSPSEIALLHVQTEPLLLLKPKQIGWEALCNSITTPHAIFCLARAMNALHDANLNPTHLVEQSIRERYRTTNSAIQQDTFAWYVGKPCQINQLKQRLSFFLDQLEWTSDATANHWPKQSFFHPVDGILPFNYFVSEDQVKTTLPDETAHDPIEDPDTQPMQQNFEVAPALVPGEYGVLQVHPQVTVQTLLEIWNQPLSPKEGWQPNQLRLQLSDTRHATQRTAGTNAS